MCVCVCVSVCLFVCVRHAAAPCKTAGPIEMPFGMWDGVGPSNHVLDGGPDPPGKRACSGIPAVGIFNNMMRRFIELLRSLVIKYGLITVTLNAENIAGALRKVTRGVHV